MNQPLAERIRPQQLSDYISQLHLVGPEGSLTQTNCQINSEFDFMGTTRNWKTTLAQIMAQRK